MGNFRWSGPVYGMVHGMVRVADFLDYRRRRIDELVEKRTAMDNEQD